MLVKVSDIDDEANLGVVRKIFYGYTWQSDDQDGDGWGIFQQIYNADGTKLGGEAQVNTYTTGHQNSPQITILNSGGWAVTWQSDGQDGDGLGTYQQVYNADGTKLGGETRVNANTSGHQDQQQVAALDDGGWVVTWKSYTEDNKYVGGDVYLQAYNGDGTTKGDETRVNTSTAGKQERQQVTALDDGGWVVVWQSYVGGSVKQGGVYLQAYNADGTAHGKETLVNTYVGGEQVNPQVTALDDAGWVVGWTSYFQDNNGTSVYQKVFQSIQNFNLTGTGASDTLVGDWGNDLLKGKGGADVLNGNAGTDTLRGDNGKDKLFGGNG